MKKAILIVVLGLLWCNVGFADTLYKGMSWREFVSMGKFIKWGEGHGPILLSQNGKYFVNIKNRKSVYVFEKKPKDKIYNILASKKPKLVKWFTSNDLSLNWKQGKKFIIDNGGSKNFVKGNRRGTGGDLDTMNVNQYISWLEKYEEEKQKEQRAEARAEAIASGDITFTINDKKEQCEAIGFTPATDKFADCVLRLVELDVKSQQANQIALAESQGNQQIADELRAQRNQQSGAYLMDLGQKLLNPPTRKTTRCTVTGVGSFKTVSCR